jgi:integrase
MPKTRGNGEGAVFKSKGVWVARIITGYDAKTGKPIRIECRRKNKQEVLNWLTKNAYKASSKLAVKPETVKLSEWLDRFVEYKQSQGTRPSTIRNYKHYRQKIDPELGHLYLHKVKPWHLQIFYQSLAKDGLKSSVKQHIHYFLKEAFKFAVKLQVIESNIYVTSEIDKPEGEKVQKAQAWTKEQASQFLRTVGDDRLFPVFFLLLKLGLRRGELLALKWSDLNGHKLSITKTFSIIEGKRIVGPPKTERGNRVIHLSDEDLFVLERQRKQQELEKSIAKRWQGEDFIFTTTVGTPLNPDNLKGHLEDLLKNRTFLKSVSMI